MNINSLTKRQQAKLVQKMLLAVEDFCTVNGIDIDQLSSDEWEILREQVVKCSKQFCALIGDEKTPLQNLSDFTEDKK